MTSPPFSVTWCVVGPGKVARAHDHHEHEAFIITQGRGLMRVDDETTEVGPGDVIFIAAWSIHELTNLDEREDLCFVDLCWEKMDEAVEGNPVGTSEQPRTQAALLTATPPTPNGDLHLGHLAGPYLAADIHRRFLLMQGIDARYVTGMDDHQSYVVTKGKHLGWSPRQVADHFSERMQATWKGAKIELDHVARPQASQDHISLAKKVFTTLWDLGAIKARTSPTLFCPSCEIYLFEAHVDGGCPHCPADSGGNACEACGRPNDCADLRNPVCHHCGGAPEVHEIERLYFPLEPHRERLERFWSETDMNPHLRALCQTMASDGLPEIAVSHPTDWGIPVPVPEFSDQCIYVWFEMAAGYLASASELWRENDVDWRGLEGETAWGPEQPDFIQFFGFDNGYFHAVLFPAVYSAFDPNIPLPTSLVSNEMYRYEGAKFSTSRNHAMWGDEILAEAPADVVRFYLAWDNPEAEQTDFRHRDFQWVVENELSRPWRAWLSSLEERLHERFYGSIPGTGAWTSEHRLFHQEVLNLIEKATGACAAKTFSPQKLARTLRELVRLGHRFGKAEAHWHGVAERFEEERTAMALELWAVRVLAQIAAPLMPNFAAALRQDLGDGEGFGTWETIPNFVSSGRKLERFRCTDAFEFSEKSTERADAERADAEVAQTPVNA